MTETEPTNAAIPTANQRLNRDFFARNPREVARDLIGTYLIRLTPHGQTLGGRVTETEAYLSEGDPASHSSRGMTQRNRSMFAAAGTLYVYSIHAKYCLNVSTETVGMGSAVLIRALEPLWGLDSMRQARGQTEIRRLTRGPAMLCQALGITTADDGIDLHACDWLGFFGAPGSTASRRQTASGEMEAFNSRSAIGISGRIGIRLGAEMPLRFFDRTSAHVSRHKNEKTR